MTMIFEVLYFRNFTQSFLTLQLKLDTIEQVRGHLAEYMRPSGWEMVTYTKMGA